RRLANKRSHTGTDRREPVTILNVEALGETIKALRCDFGDDADHWVPKSQILPSSEVKRRGDRGQLVVRKWWARTAGVLNFTRAPSTWPCLEHFLHLLRELDARLGVNDPERRIINTINEVLSKGLGQATTLEGTRAFTETEADQDGGSGGSGNDRQ